METMTAGDGEGVDLRGLIEILSQPHPPQPGYLFTVVFNKPTKFVLN